MRYNVIYILIAFLCVSCSNSSVEPTDERIGLNYMPLEVGTFRVYDIFEINFALVGTDTSQYQLRETVIDSTVSTNDEVVYSILREVRASEEEFWDRDSLWAVRLDKQRAIGIENNESFVKLVFPLEEELVWDGNAYNTRPVEFYRYERELGDTTLNENVFRNLWRVVQSELEPDLLGRNERYEIYAPDVGLIIKNVIIWSFCQSDCSSENQVVAGRELRQSLISYGKNE